MDYEKVHLNKTYNNHFLHRKLVYDPCNPLRLPPNTIRLKFKDNITPTTVAGTYTQVSSSPNIWDLTYDNRHWSHLFDGKVDLLEVIGANTTNVNYMMYMFNGCTNLSGVCLFDTSNVNDVNYMFTSCTSLSSIPTFDTSNVSSMNYTFRSCTSLTSIPLFDTSKINDISHAFELCYNVQSGALALYNQASTQSTPPVYHTDTFYKCGISSEQGNAELAQIPNDWK